MNVQLTNAQMVAASRLVQRFGNRYSSQGNIFRGGLFTQDDNLKHNIYYDFGYPAAGSLTFEHFYHTWKRNGIASALVTKTASKTWQTPPKLLEEKEAHEETELERQIRQHFGRLRFWQKLKTADARSMVGKYSGVILQLADGRPYDQPVETVPGGVEGIVSVLPAWEGQLETSDWDFDPNSPTYGQPKMFRFNESGVDPEQGKVRSFQVHPDRAYIWSEDRTTWGESKLEPIYNALMDVEKIRGAGGEGFWKSAKAQPVLSADTEVDFNQLATMLGTDLDGLPDKLDEVVAAWSKGFDESLILQGMEAKALDIRMPTNPEKFHANPMQEIAASWPIPQKVLTGMQTGERASTEDAREWAQTNMSRREGMVVPNIMDLVHRFERWGILPERDWYIEWEDLTAPSLEEKLNISEKMAKVNKAMFATGDVVFTDEEIRSVANYPAAAEDTLTEFDDDEEEDEDGNI